MKETFANEKPMEILLEAIKQPIQQCFLSAELCSNVLLPLKYKIRLLGSQL
ncbi:hypothetical protein ACE01N_06180 [Saccharicrinis sp. FJH2]|uniref:hypothetical protein n=1 Tax=Saccharicrinis sp. FJH65 TaxID=3344659 RepID=UPI0035F3737B